jgi:hypothetical protein
MVGSVPFYETAGDKSGAILALSTKYREKRGMTDMLQYDHECCFQFPAQIQTYTWDQPGF